MTSLPLFRSTSEVVSATTPDDPTYCIAPSRLTDNAVEFTRRFPGEVAYAIKCNSHPLVLKALVEGGIGSFDVASVPEMVAARAACSGASLHFMHPIKTSSAIAEAYSRFAVRSFAVDHPDEIDKIIAAIGTPEPDTTLFVRLSTDGGVGAVTYDLSAKFGARRDRAIGMLHAIDAAGLTPGLCFHVGSQVRDAATYQASLSLAQDILKTANVPVPALDIGGGFPAAYLGEEEAHWTDVLMAAVDMLKATGLASNSTLLCEPGRAMVADGVSLLTRVLLRDDDLLFINDGAWGAFSETLTADTRWPARVFRAGGTRAAGNTSPFKIAGVTCDSCDMLTGIYDLPNEIGRGDWIEFAMMGAYSQVLRTDFNGFGHHTVVLVDQPFDGTD